MRHHPVSGSPLPSCEGPVAEPGPCSIPARTVPARSTSPTCEDSQRDFNRLPDRFANCGRGRDRPIAAITRSTSNIDTEDSLARRKVRQGSRNLTRPGSQAGPALDQAEATVRTLARPGGERHSTRRAGNLRRIVIDHRRRRTALCDAGLSIPVLPQHLGGPVHITACDRKPEPWASAAARAVGAHDPSRDPGLLQDGTQPLETPHITLGENLQVVIHGRRRYHASSSHR